MTGEKSMFLAMCGQCFFTSFMGAVKSSKSTAFIFFNIVLLSLNIPAYVKALIRMKAISSFEYKSSNEMIKYINVTIVLR